jgi:hypothetical protein
MKFVAILASLFSALTANGEMYNILSLDSCLYDGYMTAKFIDYLE